MGPEIWSYVNTNTGGTIYNIYTNKWIIALKGIADIRYNKDESNNGFTVSNTGSAIVDTEPKKSSCQYTCFWCSSTNRAFVKTIRNWYGGCTSSPQYAIQNQNYSKTNQL